MLQSKIKSYRAVSVKALLLSALLFASFTLFAQGIKIAGKISDKTGSLPGVTVMLKGTTKGTITDIDGNYSIEADNLNQTLVISFVGYKTKEVNIAGKTNISTTIDLDIKTLETAVAVGYGTVKKSDLTGAVSVVDVKELQKTSVTTVSGALKGRVPGLTVSTSGNPGQAASVSLRGVSSFFGSTNPLYVIDGLLTDDSRDFNPNDVESIQVLKDGSSAAIYGSRAANGVIIITTKRGQKGKPKYNFSYNSGWQAPFKRFNMMETPEWIDFNKIRYDNSKLTADPRTAPVITDPGVNTDWIDPVFQAGRMKEYNFSSSAGTDNSQYYVSTNYFKHEGIVAGPEFDRFTTRINGTVKSKRFKLDENLLLSKSHNVTPDVSFTNAMRMPTVIPIYRPDGSYGNGVDNFSDSTGKTPNLTLGGNPVGVKNENQRTIDLYKAQGGLTPEYKILPGLKYKLNLGLEYYTYMDKNIKQPITNSANEGGLEGDLKTSYYESHQSKTNALIENTITLDTTIREKHHINLVVGYTRQAETWFGMEATGDTILIRDNSGNYYYNFTNAKYQNIKGGGAPTRVNHTGRLARLMYNYNGLYYFTASVRRDASSYFRSNVRSGSFPAVSGMWKINNEKFFKKNEKLKIISDLKIRAGYGILGNDQLTGDAYPTIEYNSNNLNYQFGPQETTNYGSLNIWGKNENLVWERKKSFNVGLDLGLWDNAFTLSADYFIHQSDSLINLRQLASYYGNEPAIFQPNAVWDNIGNIRNKGIELTATYKNYKHKIGWEVMGNVTHIKNKIITYGGLNASYVDNGYARSEVDNSIGELFVWQQEGFYKEGDPELQYMMVTGQPVKVGQLKFKDINGFDANGNLTGKPDSVIDNADRVFVGHGLPKLTFSLNVKLSYKEFDMTMYFYGNLGRKIYNSSKYWLQNFGDNGNYGAGLINEVWSPTNQENATAQQPVFSGTLKDNSTFYIESGNFLRMSTFQIGYTIPASRLSKVGIDNVRLYLSGENIFTLTKYTGLDVDFFVDQNGSRFSPGFDGNGFPNVRTVSLGAQLSF